MKTVWGEIRGAAEKAWHCKDDEILIDGPAGTGKTTAMLLKALAVMEKYPGARILLVRKTRASMTQSVLVTLEDKILGAGHPLIGNVKRDNRASYRHPNGSTLVLGGLDNVDRIMSTDYDLIICFEATEISENDCETLTTRLRNHMMPYQQIILDCNPSGPRHWIIERANKGSMTRFPSRHEDNPLLYDSDRGLFTEIGAQYIEKLNRLSGHRLLRLAKGVWASAEGLVYPEFDIAVHVIPRAQVPSCGFHFGAIDFGYTNPFVAQLWGVDHDGRMYRMREIYYTCRTVEDHARQLKKWEAEYRISEWVADHDAEDRATLAKPHIGIYTRRARKDVRPGIDAVTLRLRKAGDGKPRIFFVADARAEVDPRLREDKKPTCTEEEFDSYQWQPPKDGRAAKEEPIKVDDHGMDTTRYAVMDVDSFNNRRW
ncbi:MAG: phage terminase large subunit [bacterium]|nr:phage terminase large subunit [bacterium]